MKDFNMCGWRLYFSANDKLACWSVRMIPMVPWVSISNVFHIQALRFSQIWLQIFSASSSHIETTILNFCYYLASTAPRPVSRFLSGWEWYCLGSVYLMHVSWCPKYFLSSRVLCVVHEDGSFGAHACRVPVCFVTQKQRWSSQSTLWFSFKQSDITITHHCLKTS